MHQIADAAVVFGLIGLAPILITQESLLNIVIMTLYAALLGQAWNILGGYGGQFSFGHAAYFGTGAYTVAVLQVQLRHQSVDRTGRWRSVRQRRLAPSSGLPPSAMACAAPISRW
jgi:ABC-type branched-subunit amino acid transport system permease subunit